MPHIDSVFAKFNGPEIFLEQGRLVFSILRTFASAGMNVHLFDNLADKDLDKYGKLIYSISGLALDRVPHQNPSSCIYLYDQPDSAELGRPWGKCVQVRFDLFAPFWTSDPIIMPFPMHPLLSGVTEADLAALRPAQRRMRVFFSGDTNHYGRVWIRYPTTKLPRLRVVNAIRQRLGDTLDLVQSSDEMCQIVRGGYRKRCVVTASSDVRIEFGDWLSTISRADFFLSPPGIVMPMCHNIVEAMAVGTIPITNYPEWMDPRLVPGENCLAFDDEDSLIAAMQQALSMDEEAIARMRARVIDYHDRYLRPHTFVDRVLSRPNRDVPILMYTERNVALRARKLGRHSILMHGTTSPRPPGVIRRLLSGLRS